MPRRWDDSLIVLCHELFCEDCGDCFDCYDDDPCGSGGIHEYDLATVEKLRAAQAEKERPR
jgi:hypothetical protein